MKFLNTKPIRLIELFAGIGSQAKALKRLGTDFEHYKVVEFDKFAIKSYNAIHGTDFEVQDITNLKGGDLEIVDTDKYTYLMTYSFPCFTGDTLVLTDKGYKEIKDISVDDKVLTHNNRFCKVSASAKTGNKTVYSIDAMGLHEVKATANHKFYVREKYREWNNLSRTDVRKFKEPKWVKLKDLNKSYYLGYAINQNSIIPEWDGIDLEWTDGRKTRHKNELSQLMDNEDFWYIIGRYIGDGWLRKQGGIVICYGKHKSDEIEQRLTKLNVNYTTVEDRTAYKVHIPKKEWGLFCSQFGKGAANKHLTKTVLNLPIPLLRSFIKGYLDADGYLSKTNTYKISSASRDLIYGIAQCVAKAYKTPFSISKDNLPSTCVIEGRVVNQKNRYNISFKKDKRKQDKAFYEDGYVWYPIKSITECGNEDVYDITVEDDHSFTANGCIAHNCQDLSVAGNGKGMSKGSGTRSGLLWEVERLLDEIEELPQLLLMENVTQVHGKKHMEDFQSWIDFLESKGYSNFYQDLNAKNYGIPQNRNRCFMVSILGDYEYKFPEPKPLTKVMKDYLEDEVDRKYYVTNEKADKLIEQLIIDGKIGIGEGHCKPMILENLGSTSKDRIPNARETDVATTLLARDFKGLSNYGSNGVVEYDRLNRENRLNKHDS